MPWLWLAGAGVMLLATACSRPPPPAPPVRPPPAPPTQHAARAPAPAPMSTLPMLESDAGTRFPERARIARYHDVRWARDRKPLGPVVPNVTDPHDAPEVVIVEQHGDDVRVVSASDSLRVLAWIKRDDLLRVVTRATWLATGPKAPPPADNGVRVLPGLAPELGAHAAGRVHVAYNDGRARFKGWLDQDRIGHVYRKRPESQRDATHLAERTAVLASPTGSRIATLSGELEYDGLDPVAGLKLLGKPQGIMQRVEYESRYFQITGFVPRTRIAPFDRKAYKSRLPGMSKFTVSGAKPVTLPGRTCLFARIGEAPIGITLTSYPTYASFARGKGGWHQVVLNTPWGLLDAMAHQQRPSETSDAGAGSWQRCTE